MHRYTGLKDPVARLREPVSPPGSVGASACGRGLQWRPAPRRQAVPDTNNINSHRAHVYFQNNRNRIAGGQNRRSAACGENPEAPPVADAARDSSEQTTSDASAPSAAARLCLRGPRWSEAVLVSKYRGLRSAPSEQADNICEDKRSRATSYACGAPSQWFDKSHLDVYPTIFRDEPLIFNS